MSAAGHHGRCQVCGRRLKRYYPTRDGRIIGAALLLCPTDPTHREQVKS